jgi:Ca-activated chloride channel family protein
VGDAKGGPIPIKRNGVVLNYKKDQNGETVITRLDETTLREIAEQTNGLYINGSNTSEVVDSIKDLLDKMDKKEFESKQIADFKDQYQWFLGLGILLFFIDIFLLERKTEWLKKLNLFNENF